MDLNVLIKKFGLEDYRKVLIPEWDDSGKTFPEQGMLFFLTAEYINKVSNKAGLGDETVISLLDIVKRVAADRELSRLVWHIYHLLFVSEKGSERNGAEMPDFSEVLGADVSVFNLLLALSGFRTGEALFSKLGIPNEVANGTFRDISIWCNYFQNELNFTGINLRILGWTHKLLYGSLYRLGRLQFGVRPFHGEVYVFRRKSDGRVHTLAKEGINFNSAGQYNGVDGLFDTSGVWHSELRRKHNAVTGNPISLRGFAENRFITLELTEWDEVLAQGDPILDIHIPGSGRMTVGACAESIAMAAEFFPKYFPNKPFKGYACHSWFLDIQYEKLLPVTSNILCFQHEFYLYPIKEGASESLWRIFGPNGLKGGLAHAPRKSQMQQMVATFLEQGGHLRGGGAFFLTADLPWGWQVYRKQNGCAKQKTSVSKLDNPARVRANHWHGTKPYV